MFDIGGSEIVLLLILALLVMGPKNLPKIAGSFARVISQVRRVTNDFKHAVEDEIRAMEVEERDKKREENAAEVHRKVGPEEGGDPDWELHDNIEEDPDDPEKETPEKTPPESAPPDGPKEESLDPNKKSPPPEKA